jgi:hypothetical protein
VCKKTSALSGAGFIFFPATASSVADVRLVFYDDFWNQTDVTAVEILNDLSIVL